MREIKFRAWYREGLCDVTNISMWQGQVSTLRVKPTGSGEYAASITDTPIMQCTGLADKNGKEIYEGDIIQRPYHVDEYLVVEFVSGAFRAHYRCGDARLDEYITLGQGEWVIVGNIYENPELLKQ